ncbi:NADH-quinone oxidoreductase subunit A [Nocardioides euryhalodurans]|uniref:NADH-quinone oxidoreductase subunit n=1 Tax=Nocardioides euryhalodurans TaxID=2518370 RepID=A0A4V1BE05_9ACTN|nr:NADH-quinone oxidoreductase subunit A [Nocardioides euryhalodurans]QBR92942.1 NADH-quinone oxidoreductase subunit A [Nocardioides euryhalodurans]
MEVYAPVVVLGALATVFAVGSIVLSQLVGPRRYNRAKLETYECGIVPVERPPETRIPVRFYTVAMTFIIFDVEIMFLIPWAIHFDAMGSFGLLAMVLFLATIGAVYAYEWRRGGLDWD